MKAGLTKGDVYVVIDTPKKAKKLKKLLDMFGESMFTIPNNEQGSHNGTDYGWGYGFSNDQWQGFNTKWLGHNGKKFKKVSIKELRNILAKEHLKEGDYVFRSDNEKGSIVKIKNIEGDIMYVDKELFLDTRNVYTEGFESISSFKRYATPEEIALLEPKELDKFAELKEAHKNGAEIEYFNPYVNKWLPSAIPIWDVYTEYRIKPEEPVKVGDWMFNPNSKKITQVKKDNHGNSLIGSGWIKIKDTELVEKLNSL